MSGIDEANVSKSDEVEPPGAVASCHELQKNNTHFLSLGGLDFSSSTGILLY